MFIVHCLLSPGERKLLEDIFSVLFTLPSSQTTTNCLVWRRCVSNKHLFTFKCWKNEINKQTRFAYCSLCLLCLPLFLDMFSKGGLSGEPVPRGGQPMEQPFGAGADQSPPPPQKGWQKPETLGCGQCSGKVVPPGPCFSGCSLRNEGLKQISSTRGCGKAAWRSLQVS